MKQENFGEICERVVDSCVFLKYEEGLQEVDIKAYGEHIAINLKEGFSLRTAFNDGYDARLTLNAEDESLQLYVELDGLSHLSTRKFNEIANLVGEEKIFSYVWTTIEK